MSYETSDRGRRRRLINIAAPATPGSTSSSGAVGVSGICDVEDAVSVGDTDAALDHFEEATAIAERLSAPFWIAQAKIGTAVALRSRNQRNDGACAARLIAEVVEIAAPRSYGRVLQQAEALG